MHSLHSLVFLHLQCFLENAGNISQFEVFSFLIIETCSGQCGPHGVSSQDGLSESRLMDLLHGAEYVLTYEDKDGDWMLVGDVPWQ